MIDVSGKLTPLKISEGYPVTGPVSSERTIFLKLKINR